MPETLTPYELIPMDLFTAKEPLIIDLVYAKKDHPENIFKTALYYERARLFLHKDLARIVMGAARKLRENYGHTLILKDGLRTTEAEKKAMSTQIIQDNPHWLEGPNVLFSKPGTGAHPRAMAVDVSVHDHKGQVVDMGTVFDTMSPQSARSYDGFSSDVSENRRRLEEAFVSEAAKRDLPMLPLPSEWWDFRFPRSYYERWNPLSDAGLPEDFRMCKAPQHHTGEWVERFDKLAKEVLNSL